MLKDLPKNQNFEIDNLIESLPTPIVIKNIKDNDITVIKNIARKQFDCCH